MRLKNRFIILSSLLIISSSTYALEVFLEPLYWRATETVDWELSNDLNSTHQNITYRTYQFNYAPGFRVGLGYENGWNTRLYFTNFYTSTNDTASGNLTSAFMGGKFAQSSPDFFYQTGQASSSINYNVIDWDLGNHFHPAEQLMLNPLIGLKGGTIHQTFNTRFQGMKSVTENITNNFFGVGPKIGIDGEITFLNREDYRYNLIASFSTAYLLGHWNINDNLYINGLNATNIAVTSRNMGAVTLQGIVGVKLDYRRFSVTLNYEINDWLNQCQIFDDATGAHNNDLVLQGAALKLSYNF